MNHLKEAIKYFESAESGDQDTVQGDLILSIVGIGHALIAIAEQLQAGNSEPSPAANWFTFNNKMGGVYCRFCAEQQGKTAKGIKELHADYCQRGQWVSKKQPEEKQTELYEITCVDCESRFYGTRGIRCDDCANYNPALRES